MIQNDDNNASGGLYSHSHTQPYTNGWVVSSTGGPPPILPEAEVFLKARRLQYIKLLDAVLDANVSLKDLPFSDKHLNALTEYELAMSIRYFRVQLAQPPQQMSQTLEQK